MTRGEAVMVGVALMLGALNFIESLIARWRDQQLHKRIATLEDERES